ncbi:DUF916 domain-containing protein [Pseudoclavibacter chungangensis]|uniref:DUF916 domain-containing protein n=1 Tax=Pseudoclavibacter chungangensis TaxID=587635 RepID=A0A7J5BRE6_9MICO|nr:DUF916 domain-containing protein [Pseudoclavibacter chungangensis]KAB1656825.1 DUF916 domain-containing protein [Pseudoclavibacter chungangensis]NYJ67277.1 hypothetical protein [Pseudoclavibacter chungangensis]
MPTLIPLRERRVRAALPIALLLGAAALSIAPLVPAQADTADAPAWTVATVDNDLGAGRANFGYEVDPGQSVTDSIRITNVGQGTLDLDVYAADAFTTTDGAIDILPTGETSTDAGSWVVPDVSELVLEPGQSSDVTFTVTVPDNATPGDHSAAIVASLPPGESIDQVQVERRLGLRIDLRVSGALAPTAEIRNLTTSYSSGWNPFGGGEIAISYELVNTGNVRLASIEDLRLAGISGTGGIALIGGEIPELLPGSSVVMSKTVATSAIGPLSGTLTVHTQPVGAGSDLPQTVTAPISLFALPWMLVVLLVIVLLVIAAILFWWWRRRRLDLLLAELDDEDEPLRAPEPAAGRASRVALRTAGAVVALVAGLAVVGGFAVEPAAAVAVTSSTRDADDIVVGIPTATSLPTTAPTSSGAPQSTGASTAGTGGTGTGTGGLAATGGDDVALVAGVGALALLAVGAALLALRRSAPHDPSGDATSVR